MVEQNEMVVEQPHLQDVAPASTSVEPTMKPTEDSHTNGSETDTSQQFNQQQLLGALQSLLNAEDADFQEQLNHLTIPEFILLMDALSEKELIKSHFRKVNQLKKQFDHQYELRLKAIGIENLNDKQRVEREKLLEQSNRFNKAFSKFNKRKEQFDSDQHSIKEKNTLQKRALLEKIKEIVMNEKVSSIGEIKEIQKQWQTIGKVTEQDNEDIFQTYRALIDQFYGLRDKYNQLIDEDRKINLEKKQKFLQELQGFIPKQETNIDLINWAETNERVKEISEQWKHIGQVPKGENERIWAEYKNVMDLFFEARRRFFEKRDSQREVDTEAREKLLFELSKYATFQTKNKEEWLAAVDNIKSIQDQWQNIGRVYSDSGKEQAKRFRKLTDEFFDRKQSFFKEKNAERDSLVKNKEDLVLKAESLENSTDWNATANELKRLQQVWHDTGTDDHKEVKKLQRRFRKACDTFFEKRKSNMEGVIKLEKENLQKKNEVCDQIEALINSTDVEEKEAKIKALEDQYSTIGNVPFKEKDKIENRFRTLSSRFLQLTIKDPLEREKKLLHNKVESIKNASNSAVKMKDEEKHIVRRIKQVEEQLANYKNNIGFFAKGKKQDILRQSIQTQIDTAQAEKDKLELQLKAFRQLVKESGAQI